MRHPNASPGKVLLVGALLAVGVGLSLFAVVVQRRERAEERSFQPLDPTV